MQIGEVAHETGVSTKTIRYYESIGVLPEPDRTPNGYRSYVATTVDRLRFIRDAQASGLTLTEIASILGLREQGASTCEHVTHLLARHLDELDRHIANLHKTRTQLAMLTDRAREMDPSDCTDPNRCQTIIGGVTTGENVAAEIHHAPRPHGH